MKVFNIFSSALILFGIVFGTFQATKSKLFTLEQIEIEQSTDDPPLSERTVLKLVNVPVGKIGIFDLNLSEIEHRLLSNDWIRTVRLQKKIPHTLVVEVEYRKPLALFQKPKNQLAYVDHNGSVFGSANSLSLPDLPLLSGFPEDRPDKIREALHLVEVWEKSAVGKISTLSTVYWDAETGYRVLLVYPLGSFSTKTISGRINRARAMVDLGQEIDEKFEQKLSRLQSVFRYLNGNFIVARQIWANSGKKIVVKTVHGS